MLAFDVYLRGILTKMLVKASSQDLIRGLCPDACPGGVICLQYADDTIQNMMKTNLGTSKPFYHALRRYLA